jgi:hypothetical protein
LGFSGCGAALCHFNEKIYLTIRFVEGISRSERWELFCASELLKEHA